MPSALRNMGMLRREMFAVKARLLHIVGHDGPADETHPLYDPQRVLGLADPELEASIRAHNVLQNVVVRLARPGKGRPLLEVVSGARRVFNARRVDPDFLVPTVVRELTDAEAILLKATENAQRVDDKPLEKARRAERMARVFGIDNARIAAAFGVEPRAVQRWLKALTAIPEVVDAVEREKIPIRAATLIAGLPPGEQHIALAQAIAAGAHAEATAAEAARRVREGKPQTESAAERAARKPVTIADVRGMVKLAATGRVKVSRAEFTALRWLAGELEDSEAPALARLRKALERERAKAAES